MVMVYVCVEYVCVCVYLSVWFLPYENEMKWKCVIFKCYSSEKLITLNILHEDVSIWYSYGT